MAYDKKLTFEEHLETAESYAIVHHQRKGSCF